MCMYNYSKYGYVCCPVPIEWISAGIRRSRKWYRLALKKWCNCCSGLCSVPFLTMTKTVNRFDKRNVNNWTVSPRNQQEQLSLSCLGTCNLSKLLWKFVENWCSSCHYQNISFFMTLPWKSNWHILSSQATVLQEFYLFNRVRAFWQRRAGIFSSHKRGDGHCNP